MAGPQGKTRCQFTKSEQTGAQPPKFANRRPGWELPELQLDLKLSSHEPLHQAQTERAVCPKCNKRKSLYCYDCLVALTAAPCLHLPCKVSIITHHEEARSKNTGVQAAILAPEDVVLHSVEQCPDFDASRAVVLFPSDDAVSVSDLDFSTVDRVFIIDSRWKKAKVLVGEGHLSGVRRVALRGTSTAFWRFHTSGVSDEGVCTVEALYHFFRQLAEGGQLPDAFKAPQYFDDLLWYFVYQHNLVREKATARYQQRTSGGKPPRSCPEEGKEQQQQQQEQHGQQQQQQQEEEKGREQETGREEHESACKRQRMESPAAGLRVDAQDTSSDVSIPQPTKPQTGGGAQHTHKPEDGT